MFPTPQLRKKLFEVVTIQKLKVTVHDNDFLVSQLPMSSVITIAATAVAIAPVTSNLFTLLVASYTYHEKLQDPE